jgi:hypothetical protein
MSSWIIPPMLFHRHGNLVLVPVPSSLGINLEVVMKDT